ncbi:MAG: Lrp/AsnC ligand binding domain-containing protein [Thermoplasmata archaeon]|jgi:DNA-binding Lrp family transcriptional regulator
MSEEIEDIMPSVLSEHQVSAVVTLKVDTKEADRIAGEIAQFEPIEDLFLVTGDTDIVAKARFRDYKELKEFLLKSLAPISGIKDTKTLIVVMTYKERGVAQ